MVAIPGLLIQTLHLGVSGKCAALCMTFFLSPLMPMGLVCPVYHDGEPRKEKPYLKKQNRNNCNNNCLEVNSIVSPRHIDWDLTLHRKPRAAPSGRVATPTPLPQNLGLTPLFHWIPLNQEKGLLCAFCRMKMLANPLATPVPEGHLHRKCVSLLDFNSYAWVWQCGTVYPMHMCLADLTLLLPTKGFFHFSLQYLVQIIFSLPPLENHLFSLPLTHLGLVNLEDN